MQSGYTAAERKILMATLDHKFLSLSPEDTAMKLLDAAVICGCKAPESQDIFHIITAIEDRFSWITTEEFLLAFRLNTYGEFKTRVEHFNLFSMDYVVKVLNQFNQHRADAVLKSEKEAEKLRQEAAKKPTPEQEQESQDDMMLRIKKDFESFKIDPTHKITMAAVKYDFLQRLKIVPVLTAEEKNTYMDRAKERRLIQLEAMKSESLPDFKAAKEILKSYYENAVRSDEQGFLKVIAKELVLVDWFKSLTEFPK
jgi:hypothetical protein